MAILNWCYGAKSPDIENAVCDAIKAAHDYRNKLCELELAKRARHYELLRALAPKFVDCESAVEKCESELGSVREAIQAERFKQRTKTPNGVEHLTKQASDIKANLKALRAVLKQAKLDAYSDPTVQQAMEANAQQHKNECATAKSSSGLYWGTEGQVVQSCKSFASGAPPRFKKYDGTGQLTVQIQGGLDCEYAERYNTLFYIGDPIDHKRRECFIRVGSADKGKPIFARVVITFHRPLPDGKIKLAYLERRKIADHARWTIRLTIDVQREKSEVLPGEVAVHTGWRMENGSLRVATVLGSDGKTYVLRLPEWHCEQYLTLDRIRAERDERFNGIKAAMIDLIKHGNWPEWVKEDTEHMHLWRSQAKLAALYWKWTKNRVAGDEYILNMLNDWRKADKHLWQHERRLSVRIVRRRKDMYRKFVHALSLSYGVAIVSPIDAKELNENTVPESLERDNTTAHRHSKWAAVSDLTQIVREKFPLRCVEIEPKNISKQCSHCGECQSAGERMRQCKACGKTEDVDDRAVRNTLARGQSALNSGALLELEAQQQVKEEKKKETLLKKQAGRAAARERKKNSMELVGG